jgi:hypothetical protein
MIWQEKLILHKNISSFIDEPTKKDLRKNGSKENDSS